MFGGRSFEVGAQRLGTAEDLVDGWLAKAEARAAESAALADRLAALTATASGADGLISVTVGAGGAVTGLTLDEAVRELAAEDIAREILETLRAAQLSLVTQATETIGRDSAAGRAVLAAYAGRVADDGG